MKDFFNAIQDLFETVLLVPFNALMPEKGYAFICFIKNPQIALHFSQQRITGILSVFNHINLAVSNHGKQSPTEDIGVDEFEFWCPKRRPEGQNVAIKIDKEYEAKQKEAQEEANI